MDRIIWTCIRVMVLIVYSLLAVLGWGIVVPGCWDGGKVLERLSAVVTYIGGRLGLGGFESMGCLGGTRSMLGR